MKKEIKIALIACAALVVLFFGLNFLKGLNLFTTDTNYYITFKNISGLSNSSPIYADGYRVGTVKDIIFDYDQKEDIKVLVGLDRSLRIPKGSRAEIESDMLAIDTLLKMRPEARVILMGPGPSYFIEKCLVDKRIIIVRGEPEATIVELLHALDENKPLSDILGISWMNNDGKVVNNGFRPLIGDLDALPLPARHFIANRRYHNPKIKRSGYTTAFTSRNCPYRCIYCVPSSLTFAREIEYKRFNGRKPTISYRTADSVDREMALLPYTVTVVSSRGGRSRG